MSCTDLGHPVPTTTRPEDSTVFAALELSRKSWLVATSSPGEERISKRVVAAGDGPGLLALLAKLRETAERRLGRAVRVVVIQEAGLDGFWVHRLLVDNGIESHVVDAASLAVDRRKRRRKTDAIDVEGLLRALMAWTRGERRVCSMVRPPSPEDEDRRRLCREREALVTERIRHTNRIKGLLAGQGILDFDPLRPKHRERLDELRTGDGRPLPPCLLAEIRRQLGRLDAVVRDLATVEAERNGLVGVRSTDRPAQSAAEAVEPGGVPEAVTIPVAPEIGPAVAPEEAAPGAASEMARRRGQCGVGDGTGRAGGAADEAQRHRAGVRRRALARSAVPQLRQPAPDRGLCRARPGSLAERRHRPRPGHRQGGQSAAAQDDDPGRLAVDPSPAGIGDQPMVRQARRDGARAGAPDRDRRRGPQAAGRVVAVRDPGRRSGGRRPEGLRSHTRRNPRTGTGPVSRVRAGGGRLEPWLRDAV